MSIWSRLKRLEYKASCHQDELNDLLRRHYEVCRRHDELVTALHMTHDDRKISRYIRKGGPEQESGNAKD